MPNDVTLNLNVNPTGFESGSDRAKRAMQGVQTQAGTTEARLHRLGNRGKRSLNNVSKGAGRAQTAMLAMAAAAAAASTALLRSSGTAFLKYDAILAEVSTLIEGTSDQMRFLERSTKDLAATFGGSAADQAQAYYDIISAGAEAGAEAQKVLVAANKLAVGGAAELSGAVDALTSVMNAYAIEGLNATEVSDLLFTAVKNGKTTIDELSTAIGRVASIAASAGVSFEALTSAIAAITASGINTNEAVTGIRAAIVAINAPTEGAVKLAKELGIAWDENALKSKGFAGTLRQLVGDTRITADVLKTLFGSTEALAVITPLLNDELKTLDDNLLDTVNSAGALDEAFAKASGSLSQRFNVEVARAKNQLLELGEPVLAGVTRALKIVNDQTEAFYAILLGLSVLIGLRVLKPVLLLGGAILNVAYQTVVATARSVYYTRSLLRQAAAAVVADGTTLTLGLRMVHLREIMKLGIRNGFRPLGVALRGLIAAARSAAGALVVLGLAIGAGVTYYLIQMNDALKASRAAVKTLDREFEALGLTLESTVDDIRALTQAERFKIVVDVTSNLPALEDGLDQVINGRRFQGKSIQSVVGNVESQLRTQLDDPETAKLVQAEFDKLQANPATIEDFVQFVRRLYIDTAGNPITNEQVKYLFDYVNGDRVAEGRRLNNEITGRTVQRGLAEQGILEYEKGIEFGTGFGDAAGSERTAAARLVERTNAFEALERQINGSNATELNYLDTLTKLDAFVAQDIISKEKQIELLDTLKQANIDAARDIISSVDAQKKAEYERADAVKQAETEIAQLTKTLDLGGISQAEYDAGVKGINARLADQIDVTKEVREGVQELTEKYNVSDSALKELNDDLVLAEQYARDLGLGFIETARLTQPIIDQIAKLTDTLKPAQEALDSLYEGSNAEFRVAERLKEANTAFDTGLAVGAENPVTEKPLTEADRRSFLRGVKESLGVGVSGTAEADIALDFGLGKTIDEAEQARLAYEALRSSVDETFAKEIQLRDARATIDRTVELKIINQDEATEVLEKIREQIYGTIEGLTEGTKAAANFFADIVTGAKSAGDAIEDFSKLLQSKLAQRGFERILSAAFPQGNEFLDFVFNADGNAFNNGKVIPFAYGGVVNRATPFGMRGGNLGVMGEAGPEAILPLKRGSDGRLGVAAQGGNGGSVVNVSVNYAVDARGTNNEAVDNLRREQLNDRARLRSDVIQIIRQGQNERVI